jgi:hypothetical protein
MEIELTKEIAKFKKWAAKIEEKERYGEWECDYQNWFEIYDGIEQLMHTKPAEQLSNEAINEIIYILARGNETEAVAYKLFKNNSFLLELKPYIISSEEVDAKWQLAAFLGMEYTNASEIEEDLIILVNDNDEYVSRMALQSLAKRKSIQTEYYAEKAWSTNHEYQRMMALYALKEVNSLYLKEYIEKAKEDGRALSS